MKNIGTIALLVVVVLVLIVVAIGVTGAQVEQARAAVAQAQATRTMANTQMMTQVMSGMAVVASFFAGGMFLAIVAGVVVVVRKVRGVGRHPRWVAGPNANFQQVHRGTPVRQAAQQPMLPAATQLHVPAAAGYPVYYPQPVQYPPAQPAYEMINEYQDEDDSAPLVFGGWQ